MKNISKYNINPSNICFEITETAAIANFKVAQGFFKNIKNLGCKLSLDDFGTGLSSFYYLKHMPVDFVKIDGSFIKNIVHDSIDRLIVESINDITHKVGAKTIAEYIENNDIKKVVTEIGIDYGQGFAIHRPEEFNNLIS